MVLNGYFNFGSLTSLHYNCESRLYLQWSCKVSLLPLRAARLSHKFNVHSVLLRPGGHIIIITIDILIIMTIIIIITTLHWFFLIPQKLVEPGNPGCVQYVLVGEGGQLTPLGPLLQVCVCVYYLIIFSRYLPSFTLCLCLSLWYSFYPKFYIISIQGGASDLGGESSASAESDDVSTKNDYNDYDEIVHADDWDRQ